ncbi:venom phosphodiesterase [Acipenser ruthenus]|uniref:venom phosphodiesterase n=1 Tax=Acipenser ruthenus TaxID=7906 RepID=UPI00145B7C00|nr:venom phosphodiesterase [Acipenser ruthenus]
MGAGKGLFQAQSKRSIIIICVLAVSIVTVILGLGLGLGLQLEKCNNQVEVPTTCKNRCYEPYEEGSKACRCDKPCVENNNCCQDFEAICLQPAQQWECTRARCGEKPIQESKCHCSEDCLSLGSCCTNYKNVCQGESQWVEDPCEEITAPQCPVSFSKQPVILISLDGFQAEYLRTWSKIIPVIEKLKTCGTHSPYMQASFPTMTFPNHYTIVTGMYPESHGVVDNNMYDPVFKASFSLGNSEKSNPRWYLGQPIWLTAMYQELKAGTFFWPGSDVKVNGSFPTIYEDYNGKVPFEERVYTVLKWLSLPEKERPHFYTLYLEEPDKSGHNSGPVSGGVIEALQGVDVIMGQLMNGLKQLNLHKCVNILLVADHGMEATSCQRMEFLNDYISNVKDLFIYQGAFGRIRAAKPEDQQTFDSAALVANLTCKKPEQQFKAFLKEHTPKRYHYANSRRIEDVTLLVDAQWLVARNKESYTYCNGGTHGYDNDYSSMQAIFIAYGPKFLYKTEVGPFANVEVYNLMCDLLEVHPAPNNGTHGSMNHLLRKPWFNPSFPTEMTEPGSCPLITLTPGDELNCSCLAMGTIENNERLNLTAAEVTASGQRHMPFGRPRVLRSNEDYCLLYQLGYVSAYNKKTVMPTWTSFTVEKPTDLDPLPDIIPNCLRADVRVPANQSLRCDFIADDTNIAEAFLYPPNLNKTQDEQYDALLMSNVVPMYPAFKRIWNYFHNVLLKKYASQYNGVNVVSGPAFDFNYDGRFDTPDQFRRFIKGTNIPIPTHYFAVLTSCDNGSQPVLDCKKALQTVSFIMPHRQDNSEVCNNQDDESKWVENLLWFHQSKVTDVEWITGLDFYQDSNRPVPDLLRMKTRPTSAIHRVV